MRVKLEKIKPKKLWLKNKIESQKNFKKRAKKKNKDQNEKKHMRNCNWRTKLKKKTCIKGIRLK